MLCDSVHRHQINVNSTVFTRFYNTNQIENKYLRPMDFNLYNFWTGQMKNLSINKSSIKVSLTFLCYKHCVLIKHCESHDILFLFLRVISNISQCWTFRFKSWWDIFFHDQNFQILEFKFYLFFLILAIFSW